jgi:hemerythrin
MFLTKYPDLKRQEAEHSKLIGTYQEKVGRYEGGELALESLIRFLEDWFLSHTREEDKKIGWHIQKLEPEIPV